MTLDFSNSIFGGDETCSSCSCKLVLSLDKIISLTVHSNVKQTLATCLEDWFVQKEVDHRATTGCSNLTPKSIINEDTEIILLYLNSAKNIDVLESCKNTIYSKSTKLLKYHLILYTNGFMS